MTAWDLVIPRGYEPGTLLLPGVYIDEKTLSHVTGLQRHLRTRY